jgi:SAM-dependent methyltransferase
MLPYASASIDLVLSHEVLEHVEDDRLAVAEIVRVLRPGGRAVIFVPNRRYPFETHGIYWRGVYRFGNIPLVNYLPDALRDRLAPHVRAYTAAGLRRLFVRSACARNPPHADFSGLRQPGAAAPGAGEVAAPRHLCAGAIAAGRLGVEPSARRGKDRSAGKSQDGADLAD